MNKFNWLDDFEIGYDKVDDQHKHLFELANQVFNAQDKIVLTQCILKLFHHIREHFKDEEQLMIQINYPDLEIHVQEHNQILLRLEEIGVHFNEEDFKPEKLLNQLVVDWLLTHILKEDMRIGEFIHQNLQATKKA
jgi:hemerythrin-like metal-binding protein